MTETDNELAGLGVEIGSGQSTLFDPTSAAENKQQRDAASKREDEALRDNMNRQAQAQVQILQNPETDYKSKLDAIAMMQSSIIPALFAEMASKFPNTDRSLVAARSVIALKEMGRVLMERKAADAAEEIDPHSPKFQMVIGWFIELLHEVMVKEGTDPILINNVFNTLANALVGWEDVVSKKLKGVSAKALANVTNPFTEEFLEKVKNPLG